MTGGYEAHSGNSYGSFSRGRGGYQGGAAHSGGGGYEGRLGYGNAGAVRRRRDSDDGEERAYKRRRDERGQL